MLFLVIRCLFFKQHRFRLWFSCRSSCILAEAVVGMEEVAVVRVVFITQTLLFSNGVIHTVTIASGGADTTGSVRGTAGSNTSITYRGFRLAPVTGNVVAEGGGGGGSGVNQGKRWSVVLVVVVIFTTLVVRHLTRLR